MTDPRPTVVSVNDLAHLSEKLRAQEPSSISGGGDRELLERAAKAAGIDYRAGSGYRVTGVGATGMPLLTKWNPLTDDGDALRLAVKLEIELHLYEGCEVDAKFDGRRQTCSEPWGKDGLAATRRAIVRAAASLTNPTEVSP